MILLYLTRHIAHHNNVLQKKYYELLLLVNIRLLHKAVMKTIFYENIDNLVRMQYLFYFAPLTFNSHPHNCININKVLYFDLKIICEKRHCICSD